jgi:thioesterase domain-containing protein/acyl carrier protein
VRSSPNLIQQWILSERVTISLVPAILGARLIAMEWPETTSLRLLITGGDALQQGPSARLPFEVVNNYGPTECTVVSTWAVLKPGAEGIPPIGHPIAGARVYLLDEEREPVPDGAVGEIYIGGRVVGRGYRNRPELTLRSFLSDPFSGEPYGRMYRTGDRGLRRPDGDIEFRGRLDRQIKIRGQRVELDEIDSVLTRHPSIDFATATIRVSQDGENQLLAYVLPRDHARVPTAHELQELLLLSLPDYMVPATFVRLRALPISPNGKLDLNMLPPPTDAQLLDGITARAPVTPIEEKVLTIVQTLLENDSVSAEDSFFLAGGHSLLGMQLVMRLREELGVNLTLRQLFEAPTVERLAGTIDAILIQKRLASIWRDLLGLGHVGLDDNFFMLGGNDVLAASLLERIAAETGRTILISDLFRCPTLRQQVELAQGKRKDKASLPPGVVALQPHGTRNSIFWMHYFSVDLARVIGDDQPLIYVGLTAEDLPALGELPTLQSIAARLVNKILASQPKGPYTLGGWCLGGILSYEIASQLRAAGHEVSLLVLVDPPNPSYVETCNSLDRIVNYMWYVLQRATRLGLMKSFVYFLGHLQKFFSRHIRTKSSRTEMRIAQETIETAALAYQPKNYDGKVLLLLASERPPHVNFLPGWQAVVPHNLQVKYVDAHHRDLLKPENVRSVADAIVSQLTSATEDRSIHCCGDTPRSTGSVQPRNLRTA